MSKKNEIQWFYIYLPTCGPCAKITPIVDTLIACGKNITKMKMDEFYKQYPDAKVRGTPSVVALNSNHQIKSMLQSHVLSALVDLGSSEPELVTMSIGEYLLRKIT
jgi:N12 class adenine-specific DNA methylase